MARTMSGAPDLAARGAQCGATSRVGLTPGQAAPRAGHTRGLWVGPPNARSPRRRWRRGAAWRCCVVPVREPIHPGVPERLPRGEIVMLDACEPDVLDRRRAAAGARDDVVELDAVRGAADPARRERPLAAAAVASPDRALHVRREVVGLRGRRRLPRVLDHPLALRLLREDE